MPKEFFYGFTGSCEVGQWLGKTWSAAALFLGLLGSVMPGQAGAAGFEILKPHRAVYEVKLEDSTDRSGISNMTGRIVYEMEGNECDGISVRYRFVTKVSANGEIFTSDQQTASFEGPDGKEFNFLTKAFVNEQLDRTVQGVARKKDNGLVVDLKSPTDRVVELPEANFISAHLIKILEQAHAGKAFSQINVFDGGEDADKILKTTNIVGKPEVIAAALDGEDKNAVTRLGQQEAWPVTIAYFDNTITNSAEPLPVYEVSFLLYEGGISRKLVMKYPDYTISGSLVALEILEKDACTIKN